MFFCQKLLGRGLVNDTANYLCCPPVLLHLSSLVVDIIIFLDLNIDSTEYMISHRPLQIETAFTPELKYIIIEHLPSLPRYLVSPLFLFNTFFHKRHCSFFN